MRTRSLLFGAAFAVAAACSSSDGGVAGNQFPGTGGSGATDGGAGTAGTAGSAGTGPACIAGTKTCSGLLPQTCEPGGFWSSGTPCTYACINGACTGSCVPGSNECEFGKTRTCDTDAEWGPKTDCEFGCDTTGVCRTGCNAGEFNCNGNEVQQCNPGPPSQWVPKSPATVCAASSGQKCDAATGTCVAMQPVGGTTPTGKYYQFAVFKVNESAFLGGYDVTSWGDYIYVNRQGTNLDVYKVTLVDSDGDTKLEPNQHPDNPNETGPIEQRTLEHVITYTKAADSAPTGPASTSSLHAQSNNDIFSLGPVRNGSITLYDFATKASTVVVQPASSSPVMSFMGFGYDDGTWYAGNESGRRVYSFHEKTKAWVAEFAYPNLAGSHMDGMEIVVSPKTGKQFVYVSDMTSDFIGQYRRDATAPEGWVQENLFEYSDATSSAVEGFGFGALNHFWATSGSFLYELGGGDIQEDLEPCAGGKQACGDGLPACPSGQFCQGGCCSSVR